MLDLWPHDLRRLVAKSHGEISNSQRGAAALAVALLQAKRTSPVSKAVQWAGQGVGNPARGFVKKP